MNVATDGAAGWIATRKFFTCLAILARKVDKPGANREQRRVGAGLKKNQRHFFFGPEEKRMVFLVKQG